MENKIVSLDFSEIAEKIVNITNYGAEDEKKKRFSTQENIRSLFYRVSDYNILNKCICDYQFHLIYKEDVKEYKMINNSYYSRENNIKALIKCFKLHKNMYSTAVKLAKLLLQLIKDKINNYYIVITNNAYGYECKHFDISGLNSENFYENDFIKNTYLKYSLFKLASVAYNNNFKLKIYFTSMMGLLTCETKTKIEDIENFNYIELGTEEQSKYYNNIIIPELNKFKTSNSDYLLYYIIICMLDIQKGDMTEHQISKIFYQVMNLIE